MESLNMKYNNCYTYTGSVINAVKEYFMHDNQRQAQWAYAAAIMDSDGCFMIARYKRGHRYDYNPMVKIAMIQDGSINYILKCTQLGYVNTVGTRKSRPNSLPMFEWRITKRSDLIAFLQGILPWLQNKKNRAEHLLEYCLNIGHKQYGQRHIRMTDSELQYREESYQKMRKLNVIKAAATTKSYGHESACDSLNS